MNDIESEYILEENLIKKLINLGYKKVKIKDEKELEGNLKKQLELLNKSALEILNLLMTNFVKF